VDLAPSTPSPLKVGVVHAKNVTGAAVQGYTSDLQADDEARGARLISLWCTTSLHNIRHVLRAMQKSLVPDSHAGDAGQLHAPGSLGIPGHNWVYR